MSPDLLQVVSSGLCVGCGACAVAAPHSITMRLKEEGAYEPVARDGGDLCQLDNATLARASAVCPFSNNSRNEDSLATEQFLNDSSEHHPVTGYHRRIVAGHVEVSDYRERGTSGGMTTWVLARLLTGGHIDAVIHVSSTGQGPPAPLSKYTISRTLEELLGGRKSRYHVQTLEEVLQEVSAVPGKYAVVGVPCFIKAVRLLCDQDATLAQRIVFTTSLFCGHLKSTLYSEYLGWAMGFPPDSASVMEIDYRHKEEGRPPNRYCAKVTGPDGREVVRGAEQIPMADWGIGIFKLGACDYCDDITGETADMSLGDAWAPPFMGDWRGANVAVARSALAAQILAEGEEDGSLDVIPWTAGDVALSQGGAVRHRRQGLAVRLTNRDRHGEWPIQKRVDRAPVAELSSAFAHKMLNREAIAQASTHHFLDARRRGDLTLFQQSMKPLVRRYDGSRRSTFWRRRATWVILRVPARVEMVIRRFARFLRLT